jgi:ubiquinone/menaquinone biosynthesis C-methylase UbiE
MLDVLMCPCCKSTLQVLNRCTACGQDFADDSGTPILTGIGAKSRHDFSIEFGYYQKDLDTLRKAMRTPPQAPPELHLPYHMKSAHAQALSGLPKGSTVVEVGCGGGQNRRFVRQLGHRYIGTDISKTRVFDWLQQHGGPDVLCDAHFLPFRDASLDAVYCSAVFEHLAFPHLAACEIARVLKPGGLFLGNVSFLEPWHDNSYFHMTPLGVVQLLRHSDVSIDCIWPERGYSGFHAIHRMGNRATKMLSAVGALMYRLYRAEYAVKLLLRGQQRQSFDDLAQQAQVSGAIFWIAHKPVAA